MSSDNTMDVRPRDAKRWTDVVNSFQALIKNERLHLWIVNVLLLRPPVLAPMSVVRGETLEDNIRELLSRLTDPDRQAFWTAITRITDKEEKYWPPTMVSPAEALRDVLSVAKLTRHYGILTWAAREIQRLLAEPITGTDLRIILATIAFFDNLHEWVPDAPNNGPDYRSVLRTMYTLFERLQSKRSLSFFDAVLMLPAVRARADAWPLLVCDAIRRYDVSNERIFPADWPLFGDEKSPEGRGLYDLRLCVRRVVADLPLIEFTFGMRLLAQQYFLMDEASIILMQILLDDELIQEKYEIIPPPDTSDMPAGAEKAAQSKIINIKPTPAFCLGFKYIQSVNMGLFRAVTHDVLVRWSKSNWALATTAHRVSADTARIMVASIRDAVRAATDTELPDIPAPPLAEDPATRNFSEFRRKKSSAVRLSSSDAKD